MEKYTTINNGTSLKMSFPYKTEFNNCEINIQFHRTLRIPDDNKKYNLPPSLGTFPLEYIDDFSDKLPTQWKEHGGVFFPMYQSEAMWMSFSSVWPFAVKIASGKVNAISGKEWTNKLEETKEGETQDYIIVPSQPWLDGFNVSKGVVRQFVAVPLNSDFTVEKQVTGESDIGGIQIMVFPMKEEEFKKIDQPKPVRLVASSASSKCFGTTALRSVILDSQMGFGAGGFMKQEIYKDKYGIDKWNDDGQRVFVHLLNSLEYKNVTGKKPPTKPLTIQDYKTYDYTWFDYYSDNKAIKGSSILSGVDSIAQIEVKQDQSILDNNVSFNPNNTPIQHIGTKKIKNGDW